MYLYYVTIQLDQKRFVEIYLSVQEYRLKTTMFRYNL